MKRLFTLLLCLLFGCEVVAQTSCGLWQKISKEAIVSGGARKLKPINYVVFSLNSSLLSNSLERELVKQKNILQLPMPDGRTRSFYFEQNHVLPPSLEAKYPAIKTYTAYATDDPKVTAKLDITPQGFHAMIFDEKGMAFVDPFTDGSDGLYQSYYKKDYAGYPGQRMTCEIDSDNSISGIVNDLNKDNFGGIMRTSNGSVLRTYRLALSCTGEYSKAVAPSATTKENVLAVMVTTINRVNGVYERELAVKFVFVSQEDTLIVLDPAGEIFSNSDGGAMLSQNQLFCDSLIQPANYDIGHVLSTGGGGRAIVGSLCLPNQKARGVSGDANPAADAFALDYVAHEMGHQFGGVHTFNDNSSGACSGNIATLDAYEPGSGSTIMAYAGICNGDDLQPHSDNYFHSSSLVLMYTVMISQNACPVSTTLSNMPSGLPNFAKTYYIPYLTPFELTAPKAIDSVADSVTTYCWEEYDLGDIGMTFARTRVGPIFRSFTPDTSRNRVFPIINQLVNGITNYIGEKLPDTARTINFKLTVRAVRNGTGSFLFPDDTVSVKVINTGRTFAVVYPNSTADDWDEDSIGIVHWYNFGTKAAPISCDSVDIFLSSDGGYTYPYFLGRFSNDGEAIVRVPHVTTGSARVKIKGAGNIFFDISDQNFTIAPRVISHFYTQNISLSPVPVKVGSSLHVAIDDARPYDVFISNSLGQQLYKGTITSSADILCNWSKGLYNVKFINYTTGDIVVKRFIVE